MLRTHSTCHIYTVIHLYTEITFKLCNDLCILFIIYNNYAMQNVACRLFTCVERFRNFQSRLSSVSVRSIFIFDYLVSDTVRLPVEKYF